MTAFDGAVIREQGVEFAVAVVKPSAMSLSNRDEALAGAENMFGGLPTVIMSQDSRGGSNYYGPKDLVAFLRNIPVESIPWRRFSWN